MITITRTPRPTPEPILYSFYDIKDMPTRVFKKRNCPTDGTSRFFSLAGITFLCQDSGWFTIANEHAWIDQEFVLADEELTIKLQ